MDFGIREAKASFFDADAVIREMDDASRKALSKFGAYVRRRARSSIRQRKAASPIGSPPSSHVGLLKQFIFFVYERERRNVIIGAAKLNKPGEAPKLMEHGGDALIRRFHADSKTFGPPRRAHYEPRPFMQPAFDTELDKAPQLYENFGNG